MRLLYALIYLIVSPFVFAKPSSPHQDMLCTLKLSAIKMIKPSESKEDELYFDLTIAKSKDKTLFLRIPQAPIHWLSSQTKSLKNIPLWEGTLHDLEEATLIVSLNEEDTSPVNVDDLIGSVHISIKNQQGKIASEWRIPENNKQLSPAKMPSKHTAKMTFNGDDAQYEIILILAFKPIKT